MSTVISYTSPGIGWDRYRPLSPGSPNSINQCCYFAWNRPVRWSLDEADGVPFDVG